MRSLAVVSGLILGLGVAVATAGPAAAAETPTCGLNNGKAATGEPIPIGAVVGKTGPDDFSSSARAADAFFKCVNANGGINGRPIKYIVTDDGWNPEQAAQVAAKLVRDEKVVAMAGNTSFVDCGANAALYEKENVLVVAGVGVPRDCFYSKNYAPTNAGPRLSNLGAAIYMHKTFGAKRFVCIAPNIPNLGEWSCGSFADWGKPRGVEVKTIIIDPATLDATSVMLQAAAFKPDVIDVNLPKGLSIPMFAAAEEQDLAKSIRFSAPTPLYSVDVPKALGKYWDGRVVVQLELEPLDKNAPDSRNLHAVLGKYGSASDPRDTFAQAGYLAARIVTDALLKLDPKKIDRTTVSEALRAVKGFRSDIMCGAWYFGPGSHHNANHAGSIAVIANGGFQLKESCIEIDDPELADIRKLEAELGLTK